jgi:hypothetical protein
MVSLNYSPSYGQTCGEIAIEIVQQIREHRAEISQPSSFRWHLATTLGGAILMLGTLLCRPLSEIGLQEMHSTYAEVFMEAVSMLHDLSLSLQSARRMEDDLRNVIDVVTSLLDKATSSPQGGFDALVPEGINNLFPYEGIDFGPQQVPQMDEDFSEVREILTESPSGMSYQHTLRALDPWEQELLSTANNSGVPWI